MKEISVLLSILLPVAFGALGWRFAANGLRLLAAPFFITSTHYLLLVAFPTIYSAFTNLDVEADMAITVQPRDLAIALGWEVFYAFSFLSVCFCVMRLFSKKARRVPGAVGYSMQRTAVVANRPVDKVLMVLVVLGWAIYIAESLAQSQSGVVRVGFGLGIPIVDQASEWLNAMVWLPSLIACAIVISAPGVSRGKLILATIPLIALVIIGITTGLRGRVTWAVLLLVGCAYMQGNRRILRVGIVLSVLIIPLVVFLGGSYRKAFQNVLSSGQSVSRITLLQVAVQEGRVFASGGDSSESNDHVRNLVWRAQGVRNSVVLYDLYERGVRGEWRPYFGSLLFPVPRALFKGKFPSGSVSPELEDAAMYYVMTYGHNQPGYMGPSLASANAFWENGILGLIAAAAISGIIWGGVLVWLPHLPVELGIILVFGLLGSLLIDGLFTMMNPSFSLVLQLWKIVLPIFLIGSLCKSRGLRGRHV